MERKFLYPLLVILVVSLLKIAFFGNQANVGLVPSAHANGAVVEWTGSTRMVTTGDDGATAYVWDFTGKTSVRKYFVENGKLRMKILELSE